MHDDIKLVQDLVFDGGAGHGGLPVEKKFPGGSKVRVLNIRFYEREK